MCRPIFKWNAHSTDSGKEVNEVKFIHSAQSIVYLIETCQVFCPPRVCKYIVNCLNCDFSDDVISVMRGIGGSHKSGKSPLNHVLLQGNTNEKFLLQGSGFSVAAVCVKNFTHPSTHDTFSQLAKSTPL